MERRRLGGRGLEVGAAVARLTCHYGSLTTLGTGFRIGPDLVLTNHHCGEECIAQNSTPDNDLVSNGFYAGARDQELRCQEEAISVLVATENVTDKVTATTAGSAACPRTATLACAPC